MLGAVMIDHDSLNRVLDLLRPEDFYREPHAIVYRAMIALSEKNEPTDFLTIHHYLQSIGQLEAAGGATSLSALADTMPTSANIISYAKIVREKSLLRRLISACSEITETSFAGVEEAENLLDLAEKKIFDISEWRVRAPFTEVKDLVKESIRRIEKLSETKSHITGLATGFDDFDKMTSGLQPQDLIIVAARPSMGKTALAINMAEHAVIRDKKSVAVFSLEMSKESLVTRMLCSQARIDSSKLRKGDITERDWHPLMKAAGDLSEAKLYIDDGASPSVLEMRAKARRLKKEKGLDLVIIDYLQLIKGNGDTYSREQEISEISRSLKGLAKELKVPVVALSQLNRAVESRAGNKRPQLSDLRESGAIEQDADLIVFIYRDEVYNENSSDKGIAEIIIGKQRNGPVGAVRLAFQNQFTRFENLSFQVEPDFASGNHENYAPEMEAGI